MIEDIGADEYNIEENDKLYILKIGSVDNKINLNISARDQQQLKNYAGEFTLEDLRRINKVFHLTPSIYDAKEEFKKAVERKKIGITERDDYIHTIFYMMIGTDTSTLSIALPRDETPRIIRLENNINMLKLGRDNLSERIAVFENEGRGIKEDLEKIQMNNSTLNQIIESVGQGIPDVSDILRGYKANMRNPNYSSNIPQEENYTSSKIDKPYTSTNLPQPYSSNIQGNQFSAIKESANEQNIESNEPLEEKSSDVGEQLEEDDDKLNKGIMKGIIKENKDIEFVQNKIEEKFPGATYKLLYKGTKDGDKAEVFHKKCDNAKMTLVIVEDNFGNRFGGFTSKDWSGQFKTKKDDYAFIFSIDKNKTYDIKPDQNAIGCYPQFGPVFFGCQIRIYDNFFTKGGTTFKKGLNYNTTEDFELTNGNQNFKVRDLEVYEVNQK